MFALRVLFIIMIYAISRNWAFYDILSDMICVDILVKHARLLLLLVRCQGADVSFPTGW